MTVWIPRSIRSAGRLVRSAAARRNALHDWRRRLAGEPALPAGPTQRVLVLCQGNICRSPFAEYWLRRLRPDLAVSSAGLAAGEGAPADSTATRVARGFDLDLAPHRSHGVLPDELRAADLVLVMEAVQRDAVLSRAPDAGPRTFLLGDFAASAPFVIADPWGCSEHVFQETFQQIVAATEGLSQRLEGKEG